MIRWVYYGHKAVKHEIVLLFLTDAAPYILKAGKILTCVSHKFYHVVEVVRLQFP